MKDRLYTITEIFNLILKISLEKKLDVKMLERTIPSNLVTGEWCQTKEENLLCLLLSSKSFYESNKANPIAMQMVISILKSASSSLLWQQLDPFIFIQYLELIDCIATSHLKLIEPILESLRDNFNDRFHSENAARVLLLILKHQSWPISGFSPFSISFFRFFYFPFPSILSVSFAFST